MNRTPVRPWIRTAAVAGCVWIAVTGSAQQQAKNGLTGEELDTRAAEVAAELRCPICRAQSVLESPVDLARDMRATIRDKLAAGESPEQIKAYFVSRYGESVLLQPPARGFNLLVYLLPLLALLVGGWLVARSIGRWSSPRPISHTAPDSGSRRDVDERLTEEDREWLERSIAER